MTSWISYYQQNFKHNLKVVASGPKRGLLYDIYDRSEGFEFLFNELFKINNTNLQIIETGTVRKPNNWKDGNSGMMFADLVKMQGGFVRSVDIKQSAVDAANSFIDQDYFKAYCSDSVAWLKSLDDLSNVDLFYLDSYDVKWADDTPSAEHHLNEFKAIEPYLKDCIVGIDDNAFKVDGTRTGKGRSIYNYLAAKDIFPLWDKYQIIYRF